MKFECEIEIRTRGAGGQRLLDLHRRDFTHRGDRTAGQTVKQRITLAISKRDILTPCTEPCDGSVLEQKSLLSVCAVAKAIVSYTLQHSSTHTRTIRSVYLLTGPYVYDKYHARMIPAYGSKI